MSISDENLTPAVSVVIPVYNRAGTIGSALASVLAQTFDDYEVVVVDDASTDDTRSVVQSMASGKLTLLTHRENRGTSAARNTGIAAARGRWIAFLDSDDSWRPEKLARQLAMLEQTGRQTRGCASGYFLHKDGRDLTISLRIAPTQFAHQILFGCTISPGTTLVVERCVFSEIGVFDENFRRLEDWDWLLRYAAHYDLTFVPEPLADIYLTTRKDLPRGNGGDPVREAIRHIGNKHLPGAASWTKWLQLKSSLLVETAATHHRNGRTIAAGVAVVAALVVYPARNFAFFRTLWRAVVTRL